MMNNLWVAFIALLGVLILIRRYLERRFQQSSRAMTLYTAIAMTGLAILAGALATYFVVVDDIVVAVLAAIGALFALHGALGAWLTLSGRQSDGWHLGFRSMNRRPGEGE